MLASSFPQLLMNSLLRKIQCKDYCLIKSNLNELNIRIPDNKPVREFINYKQGNSNDTSTPSDSLLMTNFDEWDFKID